MTASASEAEELHLRAERMPYGRDRAAVHRRAVDLADATTDLDLAFRVRFGSITSATYGGDPMGAVTAFTWCLAHHDAEPERFAAYDHDLAWTHKWIPGKAARFPTVPLDRIRSIIDDLERRHEARGAGRRSSIAERMSVGLRTGSPDVALRELLADWRASARSSLSDCEMCEASLEVRVMERLGEAPEALLSVVGPFLRGERRICADGPAELQFIALRALLPAGRADEARPVLWAMLRATADRGDRTTEPALLANLLARVGELDRAGAIALRELVHLADPPTPADEVESAAAIAGALSLAAPRLGPEVDLPDRRPQHLQALPGRAALDDVVAALRARVDELAAQFGARDGNDHVRRSADGLMAPEPLPQLRLEEAEPTRVLAAPPDNSSAADLGTAPPEVAAVLSAEDLPTDWDELDQWASDNHGRFRALALREALTGLLDRPDLDPARQVVALLWSTDPGDLARVPTMRRAGDDRSLPLPLRVRALARAALTTASAATAEEAAELVRAAGELAADLDPADSAHVRGLVTHHRTAATVHRWAGDHEAADRELDRIDALAVEPAARCAVWYERLDRVDHHSGQTRPPAEGDPEGVPALLTAALDAARGGAAGAPAAVLALRVAVLALDHDQPDLAGDAAAFAAELTGRSPEPDARGLQFKALLNLADARGTTGGPAAAVEVQRQAVDVARSIGEPHHLGWARRGLAFQLQALGRTDEAIVLMDEAADLLAEGGDPRNACHLDVRRGWLELDLDDAARAERAAARARRRLEDVPAELRPPLELDVAELEATAVERLGDHHEAALRWERVADLAPTAGRPGAGYRSAAALAHHRAGDLDAALQALDAADAEAPELPDDLRPWYEARAWSRRAQVYVREGRAPEAIELAERAATGFRTAGDLVAAAEALMHAAHHTHDSAGAAEALGRYSKALDAALAAGNLHLISDIRWSWAEALEESGDPGAADEQRRLTGA